MRAVVDDRAHLQRMLDFEAALARAEAAVAVIPASCRRPDRRCLPRPSATTSPPSARPPRAPATSRRAVIAALADEVAKTDAEAARFVHWGASRPGPDRQRADARAARRDRRAAHRPQPRHRRLHGDRRPPPPHRRGGAHLAPARAADAVRAQARGLCRRAGALARAAAPAAQGSAGAAIRRRRRNAGGARRERPCGHRPAGRAARPAGAGRAVARPQRPARRDRLRARDPHRHLRQDRARRRAADADRGRRSARAAALADRRSAPACRTSAVPTPRPSASRPRRIAPNLLATIIAGQVQEHERGLGGWQAQWHAVPGAAAGHLRRARRRRRARAGPRNRRRAHAQQSRDRAGPDHGRGGDDGARRQARPASGAS